MMRYDFITLSVGLLLTSFAGYGAMKNDVAEITSGKLHIHGKVISGACVVTSDNVDMHVDMGQFTLHGFKQPGDITTAARPFTVHLADCKSEISSGVNISFSGRANPQMPNLFQVLSDDESTENVSQSSEDSHVGLLISGPQGKQIRPDGAPVVLRQASGKDTEIHFIARYLASSVRVHPEELHSEVRLNIAYP